MYWNAEAGPRSEDGFTHPDQLPRRTWLPPREPAEPIAFLQLADVPAAVVGEARIYVYLRALGFVVSFPSMAYRSYLAAHGVTRPLIVAVVAGNLVNAALDLVLIYGVGPLPALGIAGAALSTDLVQVGGATLYAAGRPRAVVGIVGGPHRDRGLPGATILDHHEAARV